MRESAWIYREALLNHRRAEWVTNPNSPRNAQVRRSWNLQEKIDEFKFDRTSKRVDELEYRLNQAKLLEYTIQGFEEYQNDGGSDDQATFPSTCCSTPRCSPFY